MLASDAPPPDVARVLAKVRTRIAGIENWTIEQWFLALTVMRRLSVKYELGLHPLHPDIIDLPSGSVCQIGHQPPRIIEVGDDRDENCTPVWRKDPDKPGGLLRTGWIRHTSLSHTSPVMIVYLDASDIHIRREVEQALRARSRSKALPRTTGPSSLSRSFQKTKRGKEAAAFKKWRKNHVIELVAILAWRAAPLRHAAKYKNHTLAFWIDDSIDSSKKTSKAMKVAKQALEALPEVMAEVRKIPISQHPKARGV